MNLTDTDRATLEQAREYFGRTWKQDLLRCWMHTAYPRNLQHIAADLQRLRNTIGTRGLAEYKS